MDWRRTAVLHYGQDGNQGHYTTALLHMEHEEAVILDDSRPPSRQPWASFDRNLVAAICEVLYPDQGLHASPEATAYLGTSLALAGADSAPIPSFGTDLHGGASWGDSNWNTGWGAQPAPASGSWGQFHRWEARTVPPMTAGQEVWTCPATSEPCPTASSIGAPWRPAARPCHYQVSPPESNPAALTQVAGFPWYVPDPEQFDPLAESDRAHQLVGAFKTFQRHREAAVSMWNHFSDGILGKRDPRLHSNATLAAFHVSVRLGYIEPDELVQRARGANGWTF